jgi:hypothetical protein
VPATAPPATSRDEDFKKSRRDVLTVARVAAGEGTPTEFCSDMPSLSWDKLKRIKL